MLSTFLLKCLYSQPELGFFSQVRLESLIEREMKVIKYIPVNHAGLPPKVLKCGADSQSISLKKTIDCELFKIHYNMYSFCVCSSSGQWKQTET